MIKAPEEYDLDPYIYSLTLAPEPASVALARTTVRAALWDWQIDHLADTAQLIVSELATNAIKFGNRATIYIYLRGDGDAYGGDTLAIEVIDDNSELPTAVDAEVDDESHRGLFLVDALATKWGVELFDKGKVVWAHLECDSSGHRNHPPEDDAPWPRLSDEGDVA